MVKISLGPDHKGLVPRIKYISLAVTEQKCGHQSDSRTPELSNQIQRKLFHKFHATRANLSTLARLSRFPLLVSGNIVTLKQCLERCINLRSICIHSDYVIRDVIVHCEFHVH